MDKNNFIKSLSIKNFSGPDVFTVKLYKIFNELVAMLLKILYKTKRKVFLLWVQHHSPKKNSPVQ